jgi:Right handed beta helix region
MFSLKKLALSLIVIIATCVAAQTGHAQNSRTWVSNAGTDTSNTQCSVTAPCLTFAHAIAETQSGGEIDCLTPGGFGGATTLTISIPVTIDCEGASNGGIQVSGMNAIAITATGAVTLIGLDINGENAAGYSGISISSNAVVNIRNCKIYGFPSMGNATGAGIFFSPNASGGVLAVDNVFIANTGAGIWQLSVAGASNMTVRNSNINNSGWGIVLQVNGGTHAGATIEQTTLAFNSIDGLSVQSTGSVALIGGSTVVNNAVGVATENGGSLYSFKNNQIGGNGSDGTPLTAYPGGPLN